MKIVSFSQILRLSFNILNNDEYGFRVAVQVWEILVHKSINNFGRYALLLSYLYNLCLVSGEVEDLTIFLNSNSLYNPSTKLIVSNWMSISSSNQLLCITL